MRNRAKHYRMVRNAFCPTGVGGGQDNSCSPNGGGSIKDKTGKEYRVVYDGDRTFSIGVPGKEDMADKGVTAGSVTLKKDKTGVMSVGVHPEFRRRGLATALYDHIEKYLGHPLKEGWATTPDGEALWKHRKNRVVANARKVKKAKRASPLRFDPTRTTTLRRQFIARLRRGFARLRLAVVDLIDRQDALGLRDRRPMVGNAFCPTGPGGGVDPTCGVIGTSSPILGKINKRLKSSGRSSLPKSWSVNENVSTKSGKGCQDGQCQTNAVNLAKSDKSLRVFAGVAVEKSSLIPGTERYKYLEGEISAVNHVWCVDKEGRVVDPTYGTKMAKEYTYVGGQVPDKIKNFPSKIDAWIYDVKKKPTTNERWRFNSDPEKLKAFQGWLKSQIQAFLIGMTDEELWRRYVEEGFKKGAGRAFEDVKPRIGWTPREADFYAGSKDQFLRSSFGRPESVSKVKLLASRSFDEMKGMTEDMTLKMGRALTDGLVRGANPREIAGDLVKQVGLSRTRAETIAQTEIIRAHAEGQLQAFEEMGVDEIGVMVEWTVTEDEALCDLCAAMQGVVLKIEEARGMIPRHPRCLPGDSLVLSRSRITSTSERWYDGDLVVVRTASGRELRCTPNHPILTDDGWVPANLLYVGSHVVCDGGREWEGVVGHNNQDVPTRIHEIAESFRGSFDVVSTEVPLSPPDFHGDGGGSEVAVIRTDRQLGDRHNLPFRKHPPQHVFVGRNVVSGIPLTAQSSFGEFLDRMFSPPGGIVGGRRLAESLVNIHFRPLERLGLAQPPAMNPPGLQQLGDGLPSDSKPSGHADLRLTPDVRFDNRVRVSDDGLDERSIYRPEDPGDDLARDTHLAREIRDGATGQVFLDEVVSTEIHEFSGHVYNLETEKGFYAAGGIITHNCRCAFLPANVGEPTDDQTRGKKGIVSAVKISARMGRDGFDTAVPVSKVRPTAPVPVTTNRHARRFSQVVKNAFCPTGPGGGVDPSCSPGLSGMNDKEVGNKFKDIAKRILGEQPTTEDNPVPYARSGFKTLVKGRALSAERYGDRIDIRFSIPGQAFLHQEKSLQPGSLEFAKMLKSLAGEFSKAGFKLINHGTGDRRQKLYEKVFKSMGLVKLNSTDWGKPTTNARRPTPPVPATTNVRRFSRLLRNVFCATGEGGGVDPTCSPGASAGAIEKMRSHTSSLTRDQKETIRSYQEDGSFDPLNNYLRTGKLAPTGDLGVDDQLFQGGFGPEAKGWAKQQIKKISSVLSSSRIPEPITVYRGVDQGTFDDVEVGSTIRDKGFMSTSIDRETAEGFSAAYGGKGQGTLLKIDVPKNARGILTDPVLDLNQQEVLFDKGQKMTVTKITTEKGQRVIHAKMEGEKSVSKPTTLKPSSPGGIDETAKAAIFSAASRHGSENLNKIARSLYREGHNLSVDQIKSILSNNSLRSL